MMASINFNPKVAEQLRYPSILGPTLKNKNMNKHNLTVENLLHLFRDGEAKASKAPAQTGQEWKDVSNQGKNYHIHSACIT